MTNSKITTEKVGFFDIEASNLVADFGIMLSYSFKEEDGKILSSAISPSELRSKKEDKELVKRCLKDMMRFDRIVTFYGARYDIPFVRSRALVHGLEFPPHHVIWHTDVWFWVRKCLKLHGNRLQFACDFLSIPSKGHRLDGKIWTRALTGDTGALKFILTHNHEDVVALEQLYKILLPFNRLTKSST